MNRTISTVTALALLFSLTACATANGNYSTPVEIAYPPAIDVPYSEVVDNVKQHLGVNVRWGGQIIGAEDVEGVTRVTVIAQPLSHNGKPDRRSSENFAGGRFIVEMKNFHDNVSSRFITVYGPITGEQTLSNGNKQITIPVIAAVKSEDWESGKQRYPAEFRHGLPYNGLGLRYGFYDGYGYYGFSYGVNPYFYPYSYPYPYFGYSHRSSRRGHHH